ncbi:Hypothetical predicted protein [Mytilus galloprovincialis]|uniref:Uncharacterized protein n=1 Tax=Mytilus galloprovincialis TaxID=29158 RepID=A0A8B6GCE0_MYTGA|nr:Hypothetical predicted protein [Mytilus galloprovincialis]
MDKNVNDTSAEELSIEIVSVEIRQPDVYIPLSDTGTEENVTSKISLEESHSAKEHLQTKQTHSHTSVTEPKLQEENTMYQIMSGALTRSLKESHSVAESLETRHTYSDSALDDMRTQNTIIMILSDETAIFNEERGSNEATKKQSLCKCKFIKTGNLEEQQNLLQKEDDIGVYF